MAAFLYIHFNWAINFQLVESILTFSLTFSDNIFPLFRQLQKEKEKVLGNKADLRFSVLFCHFFFYYLAFKWHRWAFHCIKILISYSYQRSDWVKAKNEMKSFIFIEQIFSKIAFMPYSELQYKSLTLHLVELRWQQHIYNHPCARDWHSVYSNPDQESMMLRDWWFIVINFAVSLISSRFHARH